ncbi:MAG: regulatory protein MarR [Actinomycetia bacterium]|nr:regulatory protein MarR [Actinomycetes bacterium]
MAKSINVEELAGAIRITVGVLIRRVRQTPIEGEPTLSEASALSRLDRGGPTTTTALAKLEQISPQSMGAILAALETRGLIERRPDSDDGRQTLVSATELAGKVLRNRRSARDERMAQVLTNGFTRRELEQLATAVPLMERLAEGI